MFNPQTKDRFSADLRGFWEVVYTDCTGQSEAIESCWTEQDAEQRADYLNETRTQDQWLDGSRFDVRLGEPRHA